MKTMKTTPLLLLLVSYSLYNCSVDAGSNPSSSRSFGRRNLPGEPYDDDDFLEKKENGFQGSGRDFNLFDTRETERPSFERLSSRSRQQPPKSNDDDIIFPKFIQEAQEWWSATFPSNLQIGWPPTCTFKVRKTFRPLRTILKVGADIPFETGVFRFHGSWEDPFIGGQLSYQGGELRLTKSWAFSMGSMNIKRLRLRCAVDTQSWKAYARLGFRTEQLTPINFLEGFPICFRTQPKETGLGVEFKSKLKLPQPEIEISTESRNNRHTKLNGMADFEVDVEEINLVLDF